MFEKQATDGVQLLLTKKIILLRETEVLIFICSSFKSVLIFYERQAHGQWFLNKFSKIIGKPKGFETGWTAGLLHITMIADFWEDAGTQNYTQWIPHDFGHLSALITITQACSLFSGHWSRWIGNARGESNWAPAMHGVWKQRPFTEGLQWPLALARAEDHSPWASTPKTLTSANQHGIFLLSSEYVTSCVLTPYCLYLYTQH